MATQDLAIRLVVKADGTTVIDQVAGKLDSMGGKAAAAGAKTESMFGAFLKANLVQNALASVTSFLTTSASKALELGDALAETEAGFTTLAQRAGVDATAALNEMRTASDGLMTDINLMKTASDLLGTGLQMSAEDMGKLTGAAKTLGEVHGVDLPQALEMFTSAIAKGNDRALVALGVDIDLKEVTDALGSSATESEKKQAAFNAVLEKASIASAGAAASGTSLHDNITRLQVAWENGLAVFGRWVNESETAGGAINWLADLIQTAFAVWPGLIEDVVRWVGEMGTAWENLKSKIAALIEPLVNVNNAFRDMIGLNTTPPEHEASLDREIKAREILIQVAKEQGVTVKSLRLGYDNEIAAVAGLAKQQNTLGAAVRNAITQRKEHTTTQAKDVVETGKSVVQTKSLSGEVAKLQKEYDLLTGAQKREIQEAIKVGMSTGDIAKQMGVTTSVIDRYKKALEDAGKAQEEAAKKAEELAKEEAELGRIIDEQVFAPVDTAKSMFEEFGITLGNFAPALDTTQQEALDTAAAFEAFGLRSREAVDSAATEMINRFQTIMQPGVATAQQIQQAWEQLVQYMQQNAGNISEPILNAFETLSPKVEQTLKAVQKTVKLSFDDIVKGIGDALSGLTIGGVDVGGLAGGLGDIAIAFKSMFTKIENDTRSMVKKIGDAMGGIAIGLTTALGSFDKFKNNLALKGAQIGGQIGSIFGGWGAVIGAAIGAIVGWAWDVFTTSTEERIEAYTKNIGVGLTAGMTDAVKKAMMSAFGTDKLSGWQVLIGLTLPTVQVIMFKQRVEAITNETADQWAARWATGMQNLITTFGNTAQEAAQQFQGLFQQLVDELKKTGGEVGPILAQQLVAMAKLGVAVDTVGLKIRNAKGELVDFGRYLVEHAGAEMFLAKWKLVLGDLDDLIEKALDAHKIESRVKQVGMALDTLFLNMNQKLAELIREGLSSEQIAQIAEQLKPQLEAIAQYNLTTLKAMQDMGKGTTEIWNAMGSSIAKQLKLMRDLGLENTEIYKNLQEQFVKLKNDAQTIAGVTGPLVDFYKKLGETGELTAKNFAQWTATAMTYLKRLIAAGATSAEIWTALSGIFEVLKTKHDEVIASIEEKMNRLFTNQKALTDQQKTAIEDYLNAGKTTLAQLEAMGVPKSVLDQIAAWRTLRDEVSGPVWDAMEKFYKKQEELKKWNDLMTNIDALFAAMGKNFIKSKEDLDTWGKEIHKIFENMRKGGMSLTDIVKQHGGSLHQLYLEYKATYGDKIPKWLRDAEKEYQKQEAARKAADEAQRKAQIAMLEALKALIKVFGGDLPDSINEAINALKKLKDANKDATDEQRNAAAQMTQDADNTRQKADEQRKTVDRVANAYKNTSTAINTTLKTGTTFYEKMKEYMQDLAADVDKVRKAFKGSGMHAAIESCSDATDKFKDKVTDAMKDAKEKTEDAEKAAEKLAAKIEKATKAAGAMQSVMSIGVEMGNINASNVGQYEQQALKFIGAMKATGADFSTIFESVKGYAESLGPLGATQITGLYDLLAKAAPYLSQLDPLKQAITDLGGAKIKRGSFDTIASTLMSIYNGAAALIGTGESAAYMKSTLATLAGVNKEWRNDVAGFAALMSAAGYQEGLPYVPYDDFPAWLHKGEAVIPAYANPFTSDGRVTGGHDGASMPITLTINVSGVVDQTGLERVVADQIIPILNREIPNNRNGIRTTIQQA